MKKLKFKALELGAQELLTREQLKQVMGGNDGSGGSGAGSCTYTKNCSSGSVSCSSASGDCSWIYDPSNSFTIGVRCDSKDYKCS